MRKIIGTLTIALLLIGGVGLFRGWFSFSTDKEAGKTKLEMTIDQDRVKEDAEAVKSQVHQLGEKIRSSSTDQQEDSVDDQGSAQKSQAGSAQSSEATAAPQQPDL